MARNRHLHRDSFLPAYSPRTAGNYERSGWLSQHPVCFRCQLPHHWLVAEETPLIAQSRVNLILTTLTYSGSMVAICLGSVMLKRLIKFTLVLFGTSFVSIVAIGLLVEPTPEQRAKWAAEAAEREAEGEVQIRLASLPRPTLKPLDYLESIRPKVDRSLARRLCEDRVKRSVNRPRTVDMYWTGLGTAELKGGGLRLEWMFSAQNHFGATFEHIAICEFGLTGGGKVEWTAFLIR